MMIGYRCGLRIGEVYALTWDDIDLKNKKLTVSKQIQWKSLPRSEEEKQRTNQHLTDALREKGNAVIENMY